jgi:MFS family permease
MVRELNKNITSGKDGLKNIFRSLKYRNYRYFFFGQSISLIGTWIQQIAIPWLVYSLTGSPFLLGLVGFVGQVPTFILAPFAGVLIDRWNRRTTLIVTQVLAMIQSVLLTVLYFSKSIDVWHIILVSMLLGCINAFDMPARQSFVIDIIEKKEDLGNAIALNSTMMNSARLIGPAIAGVLISIAGEGVCFLLNGISYIFVIVFLLMMRVSPRKEIAEKSPVFQGLKEGFLYTFGFMPIRYMILLLALVSLMGMPFTVLMPVFAKSILHGGSHTYGFLMGASGIGALIGAIYMASRKSVLGLAKNIPLFAGIFGIGLIAFSLSHNFVLSCLILLVTGLGMIMQMTSTNTILQTIVDNDKRGRVMSFYTMAFIGTAPFGSLFAGFLASKIGAPYTVIIGGAACLIGSIIYARKLPEIRKMVRLIYTKMGIIQESGAEIHSPTN